MAQKTDNSGRFYDFPDDKRPYVSVTTFLGIIGKPFLMPWAAKMERELIRELASQGKSLEEILEYLHPKQPYGYQLSNEVSSELGNKVHKAIDYTLKDLKLPKLTKQERKVYDHWLEWYEAQCYELKGAEKVVRSRKRGFAGTEDADVITESGKGKRLIVDWKTGKNHYAEHILQNLAYQAANLEEGIETDGGLLVYIKENNDISKDAFFVPKLTPELFEPVEYALGLWRWANKKPWKEN